MNAPSAPDGGPQPGGGEDLVNWAFGAQSVQVARSELKRAHLPLDDLMVEALNDAVLANIIRHVERNPQQRYENVPGYGRRVTRFTLTRLASGKNVVDISELDLPEESPEPLRNEVLDSTRFYIEQAGGPLWLMAASLAYVTLAAYEDVRPSSAPWPKAGAKLQVALGWPALWLAGVQEVFPAETGDGKRRRRNRSITRVIEQVTTAVAATRRRGI